MIETHWDVKNGADCRPSIFWMEVIPWTCPQRSPGMVGAMPRVDAVLQMPMCHWPRTSKVQESRRIPWTFSSLFIWGSVEDLYQNVLWSVNCSWVVRAKSRMSCIHPSRWTGEICWFTFCISPILLQTENSWPTTRRFWWPSEPRARTVWIKKKSVL